MTRWTGQGWTLEVDGNRLLLDRGDQSSVFVGAATACLSILVVVPLAAPSPTTPMFTTSERALDGDAAEVRATITGLALDAACV